MRTPNATPEDAHQMLIGNGYVVKYGKQTICYTAVASQAEVEASRHEAEAYKIVRGSDGKIYLEDIEYLPPTAAEEIAARISEEITGGRNNPISPITKQRAILLMKSSGLERGLAKEAFAIIYPSAREEQFNRMWDSFSRETTDSRQRFLDYAVSKGVERVTEKLLQKNLDACAKEVFESGIGILSFKDVCAKAEQYGVIDPDYSRRAMSHVEESLKRMQLERSIGDDVFSLAESDTLILRMAESGNREGISERLQNTRSIDKIYADEIADEIVSSYRVMKRLKLR